LGKLDAKVHQVDSYVRERLALYDSKKRGKSGRRWATVHTYAWFKDIGLHQLSGSVRYGHAATAAP
jgi:RNA-directed DNA polymerase